MMAMRGAEVLLYGLMILLPLSSLIARRPRLGAVARMALTWALIFGVGLLLASQRDRIVDTARGLLAEQRISG